MICKNGAEALCFVYAFIMAWNVFRELGGRICEWSEESWDEEGC
ncbi:hypothetical protein [Bartonella sp. OT172YNZD]